MQFTRPLGSLIARIPIGGRFFSLPRFVAEDLATMLGETGDAAIVLLRISVPIMVEWHERAAIVLALCFM
jgi:hypothetical protein